MTALSEALRKPIDLLVLGFNYRDTPVELRERLYFKEEEAKAAMQTLCSRDKIAESLILSTCNRVEIYTATPSPQDAETILFSTLSEVRGIDADHLHRMAYRYAGLAAVQHSMRVTSSLDSLVVGEPQITGQVKSAFRLAETAGTLGPCLKRLFTTAFGVAKQIRTETEIGRGAVSVGYAACELAKEIFGNLSEKRVLVLGAGEMGESILSHLVSQKLSRLAIANRSPDRAKDLQSRFGGEILSLSESVDTLCGDRAIDIAIASLTTDKPIWTYDEIHEKAKLRKNPLFIIDVSVPRAIDPKIHTIPGVYLYNIDDLERVVSQNAVARRAEAESAERLAETAALSLYRAMTDCHIAPTIASLSQKFHAIKDQELQKTLRKNSSLGPDVEEALRRCADSIVNKILHEPILELRENQAKHPEDHSKLRHLIDTLSALFKLE